MLTPPSTLQPRKYIKDQNKPIKFLTAFLLGLLDLAANEENDWK